MIDFIIADIKGITKVVSLAQKHILPQFYAQRVFYKLVVRSIEIHRSGRFRPWIRLRITYLDVKILLRMVSRVTFKYNYTAVEG